jgi:hypothetical protein
LLSHANLTFYRTIGLCLFLAACCEKTIFGTLFLSYLLTLISLSVILSKNSPIFRMLPKAFLIIGFYYEVLLLLGVHIPAFKNEVSGNLIVIAPMVFCGLMAYSRISVTTASSNYSFAIFVGPTIFISFLTFAYIRFGGVLTWAMSGDSRNHVYQMRAVIDRGGIILFNGYPALANGISGLMGGWKYNSISAGSGHLSSEIHILGLSSAISLVICALFSGLLLKKNPDRSPSLFTLSAILISAIPFSQVFLNTYFTEGFFPSAFSLAVLLAVIFEVTRDDSTLVSNIATCTMGSALVLLTFPLLLPIILPCFLLSFFRYFSFKRADRFANTQFWLKFGIVASLLLPVLLIEIGAKISVVSDYVTLHLNNYGRISPVSIWGLWVLTAIAALAFIFSDRSNIYISSLGLFIGTVSIKFATTLDHLLQENYYLNKFLWISTTLMIILNLVIAASFFSSRFSILKRSISSLVLAGLVVLATVPLLQDFPLKSNLYKLASSPQYPSVADAHLITSTNGNIPRSIFWRVSPDYEATQVIDIWITLGFDFDHGAFSFGYNSDVFSLDAVCGFAKANQPSTIWVVSKEVQSFVRSVCAADGVKTKVIPS